jgi:hypothetical protein
LNLFFLFVLWLMIPLSTNNYAQDIPVTLPELSYHLTARPWEPIKTSSEQLLKTIEEICEIAAKFQAENGAIIDPYLNREHQYSTPYFGFAVGVLLKNGTSYHLKKQGILAIEHATKCLAGGKTAIPDAHGEFFIAPLSKSLELYKEYIPDSTYQNWKKRIGTPIEKVMGDLSGRLNNWRTYAMKGEWFRAQTGLVPVNQAINFIENAWNFQTQRQRIFLDKWNLYQDWSSDPQSYAVEAVGRANLAALVLEDYSGPAKNEILQAVRQGTQTSLLLLSPDGQCPPNGRTDNHIFNDVIYQLLFEMMGEDAFSREEKQLAGQYRHSANLAYNSILRWRRKDPRWFGSFFITKNFFDPQARIGYQPASQWGNYNGAVMLHLAEAVLVRKSMIPEQPSPTEIGGYAFCTDARFSSFVANAGGMQILVNLRGASVAKYDKFWTPLGVVRFSRTNWDGRLGPSDGIYDPESGTEVFFTRGSDETVDTFKAGAGITFGPTWKQGDHWVRIADLFKHYRITPSIEYVHPLLVKFTLTYHYVTGRGGPYFRQEFTVTPDGILTKLISLQKIPYGLTLPLLEDDGRKLQIKIIPSIASTTYPNGPDKQNFICLNSDAKLEESGPAIQSTYGWLKPIRVSSESDTISVFIYPKGPGDPSAEEVKNSFRIEKNGFVSILGKIDNLIYIGRNAAGGMGNVIHLNSDQRADIQFNQICCFMLQLKDNQIKRGEVDRDVTMTYLGNNYHLTAFQPGMIE